jgi:hypothetical protein
MMTTDQKSPIGSVEWPDGGPVATLFVDGTWSVPSRPALEPALKLVYSDEYQGPQDGPFGPGILSALASQVGGVAKVLPTTSPGPYDEIEF